MEVIILEGVESVIDVMINETRDTKLRYNDKIIGQLVRRNDEIPQIPLIFWYYQTQYFLFKEIQDEGHDFARHVYTKADINVRRCVLGYS